MITWAKIFAGVVGLFNAFAQWQAREQAEADGAAIQRGSDLAVDVEHVNKSAKAKATDDEINDPNNRD